MRETKQYLHRDTEQVYVSDYSLIDKHEIRGKAEDDPAEYSLTIKHADQLYTVAVPAEVYDEAKSGEQLKNANLRYDEERKTIEYVADQPTLHSLLLKWAKLTVLVLLIVFFVYNWRNQDFHINWQ